METAPVSRGAAAMTLALGAITVGVGACSEHQPAGPGGVAARIVSVAALPNPANALSALVTYSATGSDSARVRYWSDSDPIALTPFIATRDERGTVAVLGLRPQTTYHAVLDVLPSSGAPIVSAPLDFRSGDLPAALRNVRLNLSGPGAPPPGYLLTSVTAADTAFAVAFDATGAIRWYRGFPAQPGEHALACEQQTDGNFTLFVGASAGWQPVSGRYYEFTPAGDSVATYTAEAPLYTDPHELLVRDAAVYLIGYDLRSLDLTSLGGTPNQVVAGHSVLRQSPDGSIAFQWSAWDHFTLDDWVGRPANLAQATQLDLDHANSIEIDPSGDYVVSFAAVTQIVKIDHTTGALRWRFGGRLSQFALVGDALGGFGIQHDVRLLSNGDLLLFDNGNYHNPPESRAVEYRLDTLALTATLVWQSRHTPPLFAPFVGSVQRFHNGHTLIGYGAAGVMTEVGPDGEVAWEGRLDVGGQVPTVFYRVRELGSLYVNQEP